jgi:hypothetical protein
VTQDVAKNRATLVAAQTANMLVRVAREFEAGWMKGYVVGVGPEFVLLCRVSDDILFDGFEACRIQDISDLVVPDPHSAFVERALSIRAQSRPSTPHVDLGSTKQLLVSASEAFPLITIHRETVDPEVCWVGTVVAVSEQSVSFREIDPDAIWDETSETYPLSEITRVDFGGLYEEALQRVAEAAQLDL